MAGAIAQVTTYVRSPHTWLAARAGWLLTAERNFPCCLLIPEILTARRYNNRSAYPKLQVRRCKAAEAEHAATLAALQAKTWDPGKGINGVIERGGK
jgi:hypothetical protein